jgi:hypothetical protein
LCFTVVGYSVDKSFNGKFTCVTKLQASIDTASIACGRPGELAWLYGKHVVAGTVESQTATTKLALVS